MARDRESIGLTAEKQRILDEIMETGWFTQGQDAARFCMAYAIREGVRPGATDGTETRWAAGNFDKTGEMKALMHALYPDNDTPVRLMEHFVNEGLSLIGMRLRAGQLRPSDLLPKDRMTLSEGWGEAPEGGAVEEAVRIIPLDDMRVEREKFKTLLPYCSLKAAAGYFGSGEAVEPEGWVEVTNLGPLDDRMFVAKAVGRSMEPKIHNGDFLVFRRDPAGTRQGKIVLAQYRGPADPETGGAFTVKKYSSEKVADGDDWRHTRITLSPLNPEFEPIDLTPEDEEAFRVLAELVGVLARNGSADSSQGEEPR